jgi:protein TonB
MPSQTLPMRNLDATAEKVGSGFALALALHVTALCLVAGWAYALHEQNLQYGDQNPTAGSIQASMVSSLPLPARRIVDKSVLASDNPSLAPKQPPPEPVQPKAMATPVAPKETPAPRKDDILIPKKDVTPPKPKAEREQPATPKRAPAAPPPPTTKATTGETANLSMPASISQLRNGTASITVAEHAFGQRYAYYIAQISRKVNDSWSEQRVDAANAQGKRTTITFTIDRDGEPIDAHVTTPSGSATLDLAALRTIQRIDTFGPLPAGNNIVIAFSFDFHAP